MRDLGGDEEVDFDTTVVVDIAGVVFLVERKAADHCWEPEVLLEGMQSSMEGRLVAADGRMNCVDIGDLAAGLAFLQATPQAGMVEEQDLDKVDDSGLVQSEDRSVIAVVINTAASKHVMKAVVVRCQQAMNCSSLLPP